MSEMTRWEEASLGSPGFEGDDTKVGSLTDARTALSGGGRAVGEGNSRIVRRIGDAVYKVDGSFDSSANRNEFSVALEGRHRLPPHIEIPSMTLHDVDGVIVLAMPYIDGETVGLCPKDDVEIEGSCDDCAFCLPTDVARAIFAVTPDGITRGNTVRQGNTYVIIDLDYPPDPMGSKVVRD